MSTLTLEINDSDLEAIASDPESAATELRWAAAMKLFEMGRLSTGAAARLADCSVPEFNSRLAEYSIDSFRQNLQELEDELKSA